VKFSENGWNQKKMVKAGITDDFTLSEFDGGNKFGLMAARTKDGRPFVIQDAQTIRNRQLAMGELTEAELPAEIEQVWSVDDWSLGIGGINQRKDPFKVAITKKVDISEPGILFRLARELRSTTYDNDPTLFEPTGFATAPFDTGGTAALTMEIWAFVGREPYSLTISGDDNAWIKGTAPQALDVYYRNGVQYSKYVVAPAWYGGSDCADCAMLYAYKDPQTANWTASTLTAGRFKFMVKARNSSNNQILWAGNHIFDTGLTLSGDHTDSDTTLDLSADPTGTIAVNDIVLMGAAGAQELMLVTAIATSAPHLTVVRGYGTAASDPAGGEKIFLYQPHVIKNSTDPTNSGSWSSATKIGEDDQPITGLAVDGDSTTVFIAKTDGVYSHGLDENGILVTQNITAEFRQFGHTGNFHGIYAWNGHILLPIGTGGLLDLDLATGLVNDISLSVLAPDQTFLHGRVLAMHGDPQHLFLLIKDTTAEKIHLVQAKLVTAEDGTQFRYNVLQEMGAGATIDDIQSNIMVDTALDNHRRVWIGFTESAVSEVPRYYPFGKIDDDVGDGFTDDTDAQVITVEFDKNLPNVPMHISSVELKSNNLLAGSRRVEMDFRVDRAIDSSGAAVYQTAPTFSTSPAQQFDFPHGTFGKLLELRVKPVLTTIGTTGPEGVSIRVIWQIQPDPREIIPMRIYLADGQQKLNGATAGSPKKLLAQLNKWDKSPSDLVLGTPNEDDDRSVLMLPGTLRIREVANEPGRRPEYIASFDLVRV